MATRIETRCSSGSNSIFYCFSLSYLLKRLTSQSENHRLWVFYPPMSAGTSYADAIQFGTSLSMVSATLQRALSDPSVLFYGSVLVSTRARIAAESPAMPSCSSAEGMADAASLSSFVGGGATLLQTVRSQVEVLELLATGTCASLSGVSASAARFVDATVRNKLNQLTVLSVCQGHVGHRIPTTPDSGNEEEEEDRKRRNLSEGENITYSALSAALGIDLETPTGLRMLEDILLDALSNGLFAGKLDRKHQQLCVRHGEVQCRDVVANPVRAASLFKGILQGWVQRCDEQISTLEGRNADAQIKAAEWKEREDTLVARRAAAMETAKTEMLRTASMTMSNRCNGPEDVSLFGAAGVAHRGAPPARSAASRSSGTKRRDM
jgi:hypothetical protein